MRVFTGRVISTKMPKTATVEVERIMQHPLYRKRIKRTKKYHVHDELGVKEGDKVRFAESRPYSKTKKWKILEVVKKEEEKKSKKKKSKKTKKKGKKK